MNKSQRDAYRKVLEQLSARTRSDASSMVEQARGGVAGQAEELSNIPMHLGDMGTEEYLYDLNTTLLANEQYIVSEAREALRRLDEGTFGKCETCGRAIAKARLDALPYTRFCVACAQANDATPEVNLNEGRPRTPRDTLAPEGEMQESRPARADFMDGPAADIPRGDVHAAGAAGGGTAVGGLAGTNVGHGDPNVAEVQEATGSGTYDSRDARAYGETPRSGPSGGAVGGTPVFKRAK